MVKTNNSRDTIPPLSQTLIGRGLSIPFSNSLLAAGALSDFQIENGFATTLSTAAKSGRLRCSYIHKDTSSFETPL